MKIKVRTTEEVGDLRGGYDVMGLLMKEIRSENPRPEALEILIQRAKKVSEIFRNVGYESQVEAYDYAIGMASEKLRLPGYTK